MSKRRTSTELDHPPIVKKSVSSTQTSGEEAFVEPIPAIAKPMKKVLFGQNPKYDWNTYKTEKKDLKLARKQTTCTFYDIAVKAKKIWETSRRSDCPKEKKQESLNEVHKLLQGHYRQVVFTHDLARIVQWIIKTGQQDILDEILSELKPHLLAMAQHKYSSYCVAKLLERGSKATAKTVVDSFLGNTVPLLCHANASNIITVAYSKHATSQQKKYMRQDFYGEIFKLDRNDDVKCLEDAFNTSIATKGATLATTTKNVKKTLIKGQFGSEIVHAVSHDLLLHLGVGTNANASTLAEREELLQLLRTGVAALPTSKHGALLAMQCFWTGSRKERKDMIKACKSFAVTLACHEHGHMLLLAMFDCVDDTKLLEKAILNVIVQHTYDLVANEYGKKVLLYLTAHRDTKYFHPQIINTLKEGDANVTSKKTMETRRAEILAVVSKPLLTVLCDSPEDFLETMNMCMLTLAILKNCPVSQENREVHHALARVLTNKELQVFENEANGKKVKVIESLGVHQLIKKMAKHEKQLYEQDNDALLFSDVLAGALDENTSWWVDCNRGTYSLLFLLESEIPSVVVAVRHFLDALAITDFAFTPLCTKLLLKRLEIAQYN